MHFWCTNCFTDEALCKVFLWPFVLLECASGRGSPSCYSRLSSPT